MAGVSQQSTLPSLSTQNVPESRFKILVASDIHLGYAEKDTIRGKRNDAIALLFLL